VRLKGEDHLLKIFAPIIKILKNLNDAQKFSFIGIILGIPIIALTLFFIIILNSDIKVTEQRYHGAHYNYLIKDLLKETQEYRYQAMLHHRDLNKQPDKLEKLSQDIEQHLTAINDYDQQLRNTKQPSPFVKQIEKRWESVIQSENLAELTESYNDFQSLLIDQLEMVASEYNLILAKDKYIYSLTNTVTKIMPRLISQLSHIQMICKHSILEMENDDKLQIIYSTSSIQNLLNELTLGRKVMLATDTNYQKRISHQDPPLVEEITRLIHFVEYEFSAESVQMEQLMDKTKDAIDSSFEFYENRISHLEATIGKQLKRLKIYRIFIFSFQLIAFVLTVYCFFGFYLSIRQSIKNARKEKEVAKDKYEETRQKLINVEQKLSRKVMQAHEDERRRISRDLHDSIGQSLYSILVKLKVAETQAKAEERGNLAEIISIVEVLMEEIRRISHTLRPEILDGLGFIPALKSYINYFQKIYAIKVHFAYTDEDTRLNQKIETQLYRICQEALINVAKHAKATTVYVSLKTTEADIFLAIEDNGQGFEVDQYLNKQSRQELGLYSMKERTELLNGHFSVTSTINEGTTINIQIPKQIDA